MQNNQHAKTLAELDASRFKHGGQYGLMCFVSMVGCEIHLQSLKLINCFMTCVNIHNHICDDA